MLTFTETNVNNEASRNAFDILKFTDMWSVSIPQRCCGDLYKNLFLSQSEGQIPGENRTICKTDRESWRSRGGYLGPQEYSTGPNQPVVVKSIKRLPPKESEVRIPDSPVSGDR